MTDLWHPRADHVPAPADKWGRYVDGYAARGVLHTTETDTYSPSTSSYYGHSSWPHSTLWRGKIYQHIPINRAARALKNAAGGVQTNNARAVQMEIVNRASKIASISDADLEALADWMQFCEEQLGIKHEFVTFYGQDAGFTLATPTAKQRMSAEAWTKFNGWCGHQHVPENCVSAEALLLGTDLRWRPAMEYVEGDELLGFDEELVEVGSTGGRRFRRSTVERNELFRAPGLRIVTEAGEIVTTLNHPWLVRFPYVNRGSRTAFVTSERLDPAKHEVYFAAKPWREERTHDAGWLAGALDADGHAHANRTTGAWVGWGQVHGPMLDRFVSEMESRGFTIKQFERGIREATFSAQPFVDVRVLGGLWEQLRALGTLRTHRLDLTKAWEGAVVGKTTRRVKILAIEEVGDHWFAGLQTSSRTYVAEGFLMHNSHWDPGKFPVNRIPTTGDNDMTPEQDAMLRDIHKVTVTNIQGVLSSFVQPMLQRIVDAVEADDVDGGSGQITAATITAIAEAVVAEEAERLKA